MCVGGKKEKKAEAQSGGLEVAALLVMLQEEKITELFCRFSFPLFFLFVGFVGNLSS